ncbi:kinesin-domain-containing protein [Piedraia hortae CBS 480.64]|uniref:Kinesin-domain-containing protein n=1 Tax=Piedraia hortae CBS 480.64 TaxID=1314780 RepID=A0A6A7C9M1_9PEZI|nr:kinesin-domain-containing protein [Piedraia hortae CBS 480.64]
MSSMRPPPTRPGPNRAQTATPTLMGRASPAESMISSRARSPKPKETADGAEETNIRVVVRCRGRNDREIRENSGVVVSTDGVKGTSVDLSMGPNALSNKTYNFDKVFSPAADQGMVFDEVVAPILDEVLGGFNCTIFAYGQTGTGKTYTMSGDITDTLPIPAASGVIPRALHSLFDRLSNEQEEKATEYSVKCSFIELYNEELRDLLAADDSVKLKIFDEANKSGRSTTLVQGMEETYIKDAFKGIQLLRQGSHKRQVAATKCNDLSSRSHTVFTVTVFMKRSKEAGEDLVSAGKLNLVDLAGSENIQRSGAENKRATEAGLINKSLLTLGRVINALVDRSSHIPYRESKLTRLLQDSLGGRTKTCIIATLSPAKSNLEETISTLDYAFRAKNIRNKPQVNQLMTKKTLLREFTAEIEKLKSELIATRQRNGVYLTTEAYEEITTESESRRILVNEQKDKIETMEANLRNRVQELFALTNNFQSLKKDNERTRELMEGTKSVLEKTEIVLEHTRRNLAEETHLRQAHEKTEEKLVSVGEDLLETLDTTTDHVNKLHSKLRRRSELQSLNRSRWQESQAHVADTTIAVEDRVEALRGEQQGLITAMVNRMREFVSSELQDLQTSQAFLGEKMAAFQQSEADVNAQTADAKSEMNKVLEEIITLRGDVKQKVGDGMNVLSSAAQRISAGIATELDEFHQQLEQSYVSLGKEFKGIFETLIRRMTEQQGEVNRLRQHIIQANTAFTEAGRASQSQLEQAVRAERDLAATERQDLLAKITALVNESAVAQEMRLEGYLNNASQQIKVSEDQFQVAQQLYSEGMDTWTVGASALVDSSLKSRDNVKAKIRSDWTLARDQVDGISATANAVHGETVKIVNNQMQQMDQQLVALDRILAKVRTQNEEHHVAHTSSLRKLAADVEESYQSIGNHLVESYQRTKAVGNDLQEQTDHLSSTLPVMGEDGDVRHALRLLRDKVQAGQITEYEATGETPIKMQYDYQTVLPRTEAHETLLDRLRNESRQLSDSPGEPVKTTSMSSPAKSSGKTAVFTDEQPPQPPLPRPAGTSGLRELDTNVPSSSHAPPPMEASEAGDVVKALPNLDGSEVKRSKLKRQYASSLGPSQHADGKLPCKRTLRSTVAGTGEGRENIPLPQGKLRNI